MTFAQDDPSNADILGYTMKITNALDEEERTYTVSHSADFSPAYVILKAKDGSTILRPAAVIRRCKELDATP